MITGSPDICGWLRLSTRSVQVNHIVFNTLGSMGDNMYLNAGPLYLAHLTSTDNLNRGLGINVSASELKPFSLCYTKYKTDTQKSTNMFVPFDNVWNDFTWAWMSEIWACVHETCHHQTSQVFVWISESNRSDLVGDLYQFREGGY